MKKGPQSLKSTENFDLRLLGYAIQLHGSSSPPQWTTVWFLERGPGSQQGLRVSSQVPASRQPQPKVLIRLSFGVLQSRPSSQRPQAEHSASPGLSRPASLSSCLAHFSEIWSQLSPSWAACPLSLFGAALCSLSAPGGPLAFSAALYYKYL